MADRSSVYITIGGQLAAEGLQDLVAAIEADAASPDWDQGFESRDAIVAHLRLGPDPLWLCGHDVAGGAFETIGAACRRNQLAYKMVWDGCTGAWGPGIKIVETTGEAIHVPLDGDSGNACFTAGMIAERGAISTGELIALIRRCDTFSPGPLRILKTAPNDGMQTGDSPGRRWPAS